MSGLSNIYTEKVKACAVHLKADPTITWHAKPHTCGVVHVWSTWMSKQTDGYIDAREFKKTPPASRVLMDEVNTHIGVYRTELKEIKKMEAERKRLAAMIVEDFI